ncbi:MAG: hypothetical protein UY03_C0004G0005 [Parcubacteria group bacterium GW2011_GWA2_47_64]|nr:MAG: hypothetical protein UY03_C0004G0005 [Parcubacteria group bacterium GW2011_GWA2_47_64]
MKFLAFFVYQPKLDHLADTSLHAGNTRSNPVSNKLVRWKTKTLLIGVFSEAIINSNADRFDFASILIEQYFTNPEPIAIS